MHRAARIAEAGHGGQVLISGATRGLVESALPQGVALRDLGRHRLRDLAVPEHLYQLVIQGLGVDFPPPRTLGPRPRSLPVQLTSLVGRAEEITEVTRLLERARLVTLSGPGGSARPGWPWPWPNGWVAASTPGWCSCPWPRSPDRAGPGGHGPGGGAEFGGASSPLEALAERLSDGAWLLVVDNLEQVLEVAGLLEELLARCPRLAMLATSRTALGLGGEQEYPVPPLPLAADPTAGRFRS